jgi:hypothetical protein
MSGSGLPLSLGRAIAEGRIKNEEGLRTLPGKSDGGEGCRCHRERLAPGKNGFERLALAPAGIQIMSRGEQSNLAPFCLTRR